VDATCPIAGARSGGITSLLRHLTYGL
jgi:hypothetical protein